MDENKAQKDDAPKLYRSYGRVKGRKLSQKQNALMQSLLPSLRIPLQDDQCNWQALQDVHEGVMLEIGFGAGEHLVHVAGVHPDMLCLGAEPFVNGVGKCLVTIEETGRKNIRIHPSDVQPLLDDMPDNYLDRVDILFPDPWPKKSHHKRRIINPVTLSKLARIMKSDAVLWLATDHTDYAAWMLEQIVLSPDFEWLAERKTDWQTPPDDWHETRYQEKAAKIGVEPVFFKCIRSR